MSNLRFAIIAAALFGVAFAGISFGMPWASKGFPSFAAHSVSPSADQHVPGFKESVKPVSRQNSTATTEVPRGDNDVGRNRMRLTAIQIAGALTQSPCDQATKAAYIVAASTYLRAASGKGAEGSFSTAMDERVRDAITAAFDAGGLTGDEFPAGLWTAPAKPRNSAAACASSTALHRQ